MLTIDWTAWTIIMLGGWTLLCLAASLQLYSSMLGRTLGRPQKNLQWLRRWALVEHQRNYLQAATIPLFLFGITAVLTSLMALVL